MPSPLQAPSPTLPLGPGPVSDFLPGACRVVRLRLLPAPWGAGGQSPCRAVAPRPVTLTGPCGPSFWVKAAAPGAQRVLVTGQGEQLCELGDGMKGWVAGQAAAGREWGRRSALG